MPNKIGRNPTERPGDGRLGRRREVAGKNNV
jgi:hypothetical protein